MGKAPPVKLRAKELSWLSFNARLLQEAADPTVPLLERLRFLGIFSSNLDEFFRVRVATLKRLVNVGKKAKDYIGHDPQTILTRLNKTVREQQSTFQTIYDILLEELKEQGISIVNETQLSPEQAEFVERYFESEVRSTLGPIMLDQLESFSDLSDQSIYLAVALWKGDKSRRPKYALIEVPTAVLSRFVRLPTGDRKHQIILIDDVIRYNLLRLFSTLDITRAEAYTIKLTRDAELDIEDDVLESFVRKVSKSLQKRKAGTPVRFVYDAEMPDNMRRFLVRKLDLKSPDSDSLPGGRYHNFKDFMQFPDVGRADLRYRRSAPLQHKDFVGQHSVMRTVREHDVLLHFPYQSFDYFIDLLREAAIDPSVTEVKITLYRVAKQSQVIHALMTAARNGKEVTAVVELQARFDEKANIRWINKLQRAGVRVIEGVPGLKVHSKLLLITRKTKKSVSHIATIGTGNFHEGTARLYSDHILFTSDARLTGEVAKVFDFLGKDFQKTSFRHLLVSPFTARRRVERLINREIKNATQGKPSAITIKTNNITDPRIIKRLYKASEVGVPVRLMVRGMFSPIVGVDGMSSNIKASGTIDRYLEHSRIWIFCNDGKEEVFLSSADLMPRNLDRRVEVVCPIYDDDIRAELIRFVDLHWRDGVKARSLAGKLKNTYREVESGRPVRAQEAIHNWLRNVLQTTQARGYSDAPRMRVAR